MIVGRLDDGKNCNVYIALILLQNLQYFLQKFKLCHSSQVLSIRFKLNILLHRRLQSQLLRRMVVKGTIYKGIFLVCIHIYLEYHCTRFCYQYVPFSFMKKQILIIQSSSKLLQSRLSIYLVQKYNCKEKKQKLACNYF